MDLNDLIWIGFLDERYRAEVHRVDQSVGTLRVYDGDEEILSERVCLSYGAQFGPDAGDVAEWEDRVARFVDDIYNKDGRVQ